MMETSVSLMIMYEDESVDVRYVNGSQLQLSPCGCEFVLVKAKDPSGHALQPAERVRQRTRFTISMYKVGLMCTLLFCLVIFIHCWLNPFDRAVILQELMVAALAFRNKYASRPYLPQELIPAEHKKVPKASCQPSLLNYVWMYFISTCIFFLLCLLQPFFSIDSDVLWPEWSSCEAEFEPGGETIIRSQEGQAVLVLSPSGEEFSTEFTCSLSQTQSQHHSMQCFSRGPAETDSQQKVSSPSCQTAGDDTEEAHQGGRSRRNETVRSRSCSPQINNAAQSKVMFHSESPLVIWKEKVLYILFHFSQPEEMYQSTTVVQHHSCSAVAHMWSYPLSLARHLWTSCLSKSKDVRTDGANDSVQADRKTNMSSISSEERRSRLPQALPLTCPSPHWHRFVD